MDQIATGQPLSARRLAGEEDFALGFATTAELDPLSDWPGQDRALEALRLAADTDHGDFNLYVLGTPGTGRHSATRQVLAEAAARRPPPPDRVYVNRFDDPRRPIATELPPGRAVELRDALRKVVNDLADDIPAIFESEDYQTRRRAIEDSYSERHEQAMGVLADAARARGVAIMRTPMGFGAAPRKGDEILPPDEYEKLPEDERNRIGAAIDELRDQLEDVLKDVPRGLKAQRAEVEELNVAMAREGVDAALADAVRRFADHLSVTRHLQALREDLIDNAELFLIREDGAQAGAFPVATSRHHLKPQFRRYAVNVIVGQDPEKASGAPVIEESLPTLANLIGRIEYASDQGTLVTNFTMIRPGALHRANGGFLILDAMQVLSEPLAWDALKRSLKSGEIAIHSASERFSLISTETLAPDPMPLKLRVVLVGDRTLYYLLAAFDPDFGRLFKLEADFDDRMERSAESALLLARLIGIMARADGLRPVTAGGVARLLAESLRLADDGERFALNLAALGDILREAELGGPIHSKGVMILSGYLAGNFAPDLPFSLWASLVFEQSYGGVEGDSASAAELFALLSALADLPIDQSLAVTGSVNQFGEVQAIGGVNEKVEGFFDTCAARGLTGRQGVLIPASNVPHLVLRPRVRDAMEAGRFRVIPIATVDEGIALLTGRSAGVRDPDGIFPPDSVNGRVEARLIGYAEARQRFGQKASPSEAGG